jgi:GNAT superfamily N-acetyltransferase
VTEPLTIRELQGDGEIAAAHSLMAVLRPHLARDGFVERVRGQRREGYRLIGGFVRERLVVLAGVREGCTLSRGVHLFVDDLVTEPDEQGKGYGGEMLRWLARDAATRGLASIWLDSRATAKGFYEKMGFMLHTAIPCSIDVSRLMA